MAGTALDVIAKPAIELTSVREELSQCIICHPKTKTPQSIDVPGVIEVILRRFNPKTLPTGEVLVYDGKGTWIKDGDKLIGMLLAAEFHGVVNDRGQPVYNTRVKNEVMQRLQELTFTRLEAFDANPELINLGNGLYNWHTGEFQPHDGTYLSRVQLPFDYNPEATCPAIDQMVVRVARPEDRQKIYELFAYLLYRGYPIQKVFILLGPGGTGKSILLDVLRAFVGPTNCCSVSMQELADDRFASSDLYTKLANICGDLDQTALKASGTLKKLSSNTDAIRAQHKGKDAFDFINHAKLIFSCNRLPPTPDDTTGFYRRFEIIPFEHVFTPEEYDAEFLAKLTALEELAGLFNKVVGSLPALLSRHAFTNQMSIEEAKARYAEMSATEDRFFELFVQEVPGCYWPKADLHARYAEYCKRLGVPAMGKNGFGRYIVRNVPWVKGRSDCGTTVGGRRVAAWPNTYFDEEAFRRWVEERKE